MTESYNFTLVLDGSDVLAPEHFEALAAHGCDDASFGERDGVQLAEFDRESGSYAEAVISAIGDIETAVPGLKAMRVETDALVGVSDIAERAGISREYVRLLAEGKRGPGGFPRPAAWISVNRALWEWSEVAAWLRGTIGKQAALDPHAEVTASINAALDFRRHGRAISPGERRPVVAWAQREAFG